MLISTTLKQLDQWFYNYYVEKLAEECQVLRELVLDNSKWESNLDLTRLRLPERAFQLNDMILLGVFHWYFDPEIRYLFNFWLEENWGGEFKEIKSAILSSKEAALGYLLVSDRWSDRDFWGNILRKPLSWFHTSGRNCTVRFKQKSGKVKKTIRHRGYKDKGSKRPEHLSIIFQKKVISPTELAARVAEQQLVELLLFEKIQKRLEQEVG